MSVHRTPESSKTKKKELDKLNKADLVAKLMQVQEDAGEAAGPHAGASGGAAGKPLAMQQVLVSLMKQQQEDSRCRDAQEVARLQDLRDERCQHEAEQERREEQEANRCKEEQEQFDRLLATLQLGLQQPPHLSARHQGVLEPLRRGTLHDSERGPIRPGHPPPPDEGVL
jgi:hypothetical protein